MGASSTLTQAANKWNDSFGNSSSSHQQPFLNMDCKAYLIYFGLILIQAFSVLNVHCEKLDRDSVSAENQHKLIASKHEKCFGASLWMVAIMSS